MLKSGLIGAGLGAVGLAGYVWRIEPHWISIVHRELPIAHLPDSLVGKRMVQISDLHIGPVVSAGYLQKAINLVNQCRADLLVVTGDIITYHAGFKPEVIGVTLRGLRLPPLGAICILGNHDYGVRWSQDRVAGQVATELKRLGLTVLRNEVADVGGLQIAGIDDLWSPNFGPSAMLESLNPHQARLALCHNPDVVDLDVWGGYRGWILTGHTHGGQCRFPLLGAPVLPVSNKRYDEGHFDLGDGRHLYISRGVGYMYRVRFNVRPEITLFTLRRAASQ